MYNRRNLFTAYALCIHRRIRSRTLSCKSNNAATAARKNRSCHGLSRRRFQSCHLLRIELLFDWLLLIRTAMSQEEGEVPEQQGGGEQASGVPPETQTPPTTPVGSGSSGEGGEWAVGKSFNTGDCCTYQGQCYKCRQSHRVDAPDWTPPNTLNLWLPVEGNEWKMNTTYNVGDQCTYGGSSYECRQGHTTYAANWIPPNTPNLWSARRTANDVSVDLRSERRI